jgi:hypothetical protein
MKNISLIATLVIAIIISSCGKKEEKKESLKKDNEIIDANLDTSQNYASYEEFVSDGSDNGITKVDTTKKSDMVYIDPSKEIQIDPPIDNTKEVKKETKKEPKKEVKKEPKKEVKKEVKKDKVVEKESTKSHELRYYIVVGSFKKYSNAQNLNAYFTTKGYSPIILPKANQYNRVAISSYSKESEARAAIQKLRVEHNDLTFWLYKW